MTLHLADLLLLSQGGREKQQVLARSISVQGVVGGLPRIGHKTWSHNFAA